MGTPDPLSRSMEFAGEAKEGGDSKHPESGAAPAPGEGGEGGEGGGIAGA